MVGGVGALHDQNQHLGADPCRHARVPLNPGQADDQPVSVALRTLGTAFMAGEAGIMSLDMGPDGANPRALSNRIDLGQRCAQGVRKTPEMTRNGQ